MTNARGLSCTTAIGALFGPVAYVTTWNAEPRLHQTLRVTPAMAGWRHRQAVGSVRLGCGAPRHRVQKSGIAEQGMDLKTYFQLFWVPAIASAALMALLWAQDGLSGRARLFLASWFLLALAAQYLGTITSSVWVAGLALQTALTIFLLLKHQLGQL